MTSLFNYTFHDVGSHIGLYQNLTQQFQRDNIPLALSSLSINLINFKAFRTSYLTETRVQSFSFKSAMYHYLFDMTITSNLNQIIKRTNCMVKHALNEITFELQTGNYFKVTFNNQNECEFDLYDLLGLRVFEQLKENKLFLCNSIINQVIDEMRKLTHVIPPNKYQLHFENLIYKLGKMTDFDALPFDYDLNATHTLIDLSYDNITFSGHVRVNIDKSRFNNLKVDVSYSVVNDNLNVGEKKRLCCLIMCFLEKMLLSFQSYFMEERNWRLCLFMI